MQLGDMMSANRLPQGKSRTPADLPQVPPSDDKGSFDEWSKVFRKQFEKTEMCRFYSQNKCKYGKRCAFAHHPDEIRRPPVLDKTAICRAWSEGNCPLTARECRFAHGRGELRFTDTVKTIMKQDRSIHPQKMSSQQPEHRSMPEVQGLRKQGDDLDSSQGHIDSLSFAALIQELQSNVLSDISKAVGKAGSLSPLQEEQPCYLQPPKVDNPLAGLAGLEALLSLNGLNGNDRSIPDINGRSLDTRQPPSSLPRFCGYCGAARGMDHLFCGDCGQRL